MKKIQTTLMLLLIFSIHSWAVNYVVTGAWDSNMNGNYIETGTVNGEPYFIHTNGNYALGYDGYVWVIGYSTSPGDIIVDYTSVDAGTPPVTGWGGVTVASVPVPVSLISFYSKCNDDRTELSWSTATETNNDYFTVERSIDGIKFQQSGIVKGAGTSTQKINYQYIETNLMNDFQYYRLKQTDFDKKETYSEIIKNNCLLPLNISISPNPSTGILNITGFAENGEYKVYDMLGTKVEDGNINLNNTLIDLSELSNGFYLIKFKFTNKIITQKICISK